MNTRTINILGLTLLLGVMGSAAAAAAETRGVGRDRALAGASWDWGTSCYAGSKAAAEETALKQCQAHKENRGCRVAITVVNVCADGVLHTAKMRVPAGRLPRR